MKKLIVLLLILFPQVLFAAETEGFPEVLDYAARNAQPTRNEIYVYGGDYFGDSFESSLMFGGEYMYHFTQHFGLGLDFGYTKSDYKENVYYSAPGFFKNDNMYIMDATAMISFPAAYRVGKHIIETDLYMLFGGGTANINSSYEPHGFIGGGMKIYTGKPWLAIRVDLKETFHTTNKPGGDNEFDQDLILVAGLSFQIPPKIAAKKQDY